MHRDSALATMLVAKIKCVVILSLAAFSAARRRTSLIFLL